MRDGLLRVSLPGKIRLPEGIKFAEFQLLLCITRRPIAGGVLDAVGIENLRQFPLAPIGRSG